MFFSLLRPVKAIFFQGLIINEYTKRLTKFFFISWPIYFNLKQGGFEDFSSLLSGMKMGFQSI